MKEMNLIYRKNLKSFLNDRKENSSLNLFFI